MSILLGDEFPNFDAESTQGHINFHDWLGDSWGILFSHPADFTPVCTTELARVVSLAPEFERRGVKMIALSIDSVQDHNAWIKDIQAYRDSSDKSLPYPILADPNRRLAVQLGMLDPKEKDGTGMPLTARCVFIVGPDKKLKLSLLYPATTGRNFDEILRVIDSLQLTQRLPCATPVDWKPGQRVMIPPNVGPEAVIKHFPNDVEVTLLPSGRPYLRHTQIKE